MHAPSYAFVLEALVSRDCEQYAKLGCNYVMQWNLGYQWQMKKENLYHSEVNNAFCAELCVNVICIKLLLTYLTRLVCGR